MNKSVKLTVYLLFDGTCKQAMEFYHSCFGGKPSLQKVGDSVIKNQTPLAMHQKILNAHLESEIVDISASNWLRPNRIPVRGQHGVSLPERRNA